MLHFDVERMVQEAKNNASEDNRRRETVQARYRRGADGGEYGNCSHQCTFAENKMITIQITYSFQEM